MQYLKIYQSLDEIPLTSLEWNQLVSHSETNTIFQTYEWFQSWWKVFGAHNQLLLIIVYENQELVGIAPLMITGRYPNRVIKFVSDGKADYCDFIINREKKAILSVITKHIFSISHQWDSIALTNIPEYSSTTKIFHETCSRYSNKIFIKINTLCPTLIIQDNQEAIIKLLNKTILKRRFNFFSKNGDLKFVNITDQELAQQYLEVFYKQHIKRWGFQNKTSLFLDSNNRKFYQELTQSLLEKQWLIFSMLEYNGKPIAFHFGFDYNSKIIWYKPSFDTDYFKHSPGKVLLRFLIHHTLINNKSEFDFSIGDEPFKNEFTNKKRMNLQVKIHKYKIQYFFERYYYHFWLKLKQQSCSIDYCKTRVYDILTIPLCSSNCKRSAPPLPTPSHDQIGNQEPVVPQYSLPHKGRWLWLGVWMVTLIILIVTRHPHSG
ncbi:MAG: GNAT family N-acetyltransferase, partial [Candidatus Competibacteraceae bacterium]|nr:GNAT family N-acetyltransferase [Candidatus Competibacteraceae bacterium]